MAPQCSVLDAATNTESSFGAHGCGNPPAAGHEIALRCRRWTDGKERTDDCGRGGYNHIRDPRQRHMESVHTDAAGDRRRLLIKDHQPTAWQRDGLVG